MSEHTVRVAAVGDLHCAKTSHAGLQPWLSRVAESADVLLLAGDLTDYGLPDEAKALVKELSSVRIPTVAVLGNHDIESGHESDVSQIFTDAGIGVLKGSACEMHGIGIAGAKGFCGGFGRHALGPWGETIVKQFVHEAVNEALKLEAALARLRTKQRIVLLHYAPIQKTVEGEPLEIYPFLGSSHLEDPICQYSVSLVLHGDAHRGQPHGLTKTGVPVYNVAMQLLMRQFADTPPFRVFEVAVSDAAAADTVHPQPPMDTREPAAPVAVDAPRGRRATDLVSH